MKVTNEFNIEFTCLRNRLFIIEGQATHDVGSEKGDYYQPSASWEDLEEVNITKIQIFSEEGDELPVNNFIRKFVAKYFENQIISEVESFFDGFDFSEDNCDPIWDGPCWER